jgi:hypothetical protein
MKLRVKSNGHEVEMKKEIFDKLPDHMKSGYQVLDKKDAPDKKDQTVSNEAKNPPPATGEKK